MTTYVVAKGDTLGRIAARFYGAAGKFPLIVAANRIPDPDKLTAGMKLVIPDAAVASGPPLQGAPTPQPVSAASEKRLATLHPSVATRARAMIQLCSHSGTEILVTQGLRTWEEQDKLYAIGRTTPPIGTKHIVTKAKGGQSYHNFGLAFDIVVLDAIGKADWDTSHPGWKIAAEIGKSLGLSWGGDWKTFKDYPHFEYTGGLTLAQCCSLYPSGLETIWARISG